MSISIISFAVIFFKLLILQKIDFPVGSNKNYYYYWRNKVIETLLKILKTKN
jgi:hypothetical protein